LIYQLAEYFGETYNPNNNTLEAFQLWKGINNELGIEVPQLGDITNYIRFLKGEVADSTFIDELLTKNDIKGLSGLERASIEKDVEDYYIANIKNKNYRPLNDYTPASREGERLGYEEIDDAEK
jgi:hypothetical protein